MDDLNDDLPPMDESKKRLIVIAVIVGIVLVAALAGWRFGLPAYWHWKEHRSMSQAGAFLAKSDYRNASLSARKALLLNPTNIAACRIMATIAGRAGVPEAVRWYQRIVDLQPGVAQNRLELAKVAFVHGKLAQAQKALDGMDEAGKNTPAYHELAGLLAVATRQMELSEKHMAEAAKMDPDNKRLQLNLAVLHVQGRNQELVQEGKDSLEKLTTDEQFRLQALRTLAMTAIRSNDLAGALSFTARLVADAKASFDDRILHLSVLASNKTQEVESYLASLRKQSENKPNQIFVLAGWMDEHAMSDEALKWLNGLSAEIKRSWPATMAQVSLLLNRKDWPALGSLLQERKWNELEFARQGFLAKLAMERNETLAGKGYWRAALREAGERLKPLTALVQMAHSWNWKEDQEELLWLIIRRFPNERWTLRELDHYYLQTGNTRALNRVYSAMLEYDAKDFMAKNNVAATSLLLRINLTQANQMAKECYALRPKDPITASTYAYSLHIQRRTDEAIRVLETLPPEQLELPSVSACYGVLLSAAGEATKARKYLNLALTVKLLPEEKALVEEALRTL